MIELQIIFVLTQFVRPEVGMLLIGLTLEGVRQAVPQLASQR